MTSEECDCVKPSYSNLSSYGSYGSSRPIIVPTLMFSRPEIFMYTLPHSLPDWMEPRQQKSTKNCWIE